LTGASGHVGGAIARRLFAQGFEVVGASRSMNAALPIETVQVDLIDTDAVKRLEEYISPCDAIVHAAASLARGLFDASISLTNCLGTQRILELGERWGVKNVIYISSVPVIGIPPAEPITEDYRINPLTAYHASKVFGEQLVRLAGNKDRSTVSLRITAPVGPGTPQTQVLAIFAARASSNQALTIFGAGTRQQNYVDVRDISIAVEECLRRNISGLYNIAGADCISDIDLAKKCIAVFESASPIEFSGRPNPDDGIVWNVSISKARRDLNYVPQFSIEESIVSASR
jgi:nucleoside-diphosphate-sugar epimerase